MKPISRWVILACAFFMIGSLIFPFWKITLFAPQYPEGVEMYIYPNGVRGEVDIINGLNHYIGMKFIHNEDFPEFGILPYWLGFLILFGFVVFFINKIKWLYTWLGLLVITGIVGLADFWKWEYDYGHNLDPLAPIRIPGMTYQPPLVGYKQLLNFVAGSFPSLGGYMIIVPGIIVAGVVFLEYRTRKKNKYALAI